MFVFSGEPAAGHCGVDIEGDCDCRDVDGAVCVEDGAPRMDIGCVHGVLCDPGFY